MALISSVLSTLPSTRSVVIIDLHDKVLDSGTAGGLLDESPYLSRSCIYSHNGIPYVIMAGEEL